jgi:hypothetical protein
MQVLWDLLNYQMERPTIYGGLMTSWFQYLSLLILGLMLIYLFRTSKKNAFQMDRSLKIIAFIMIGFEIYKQILFTYTNGWSFRWYAFPFQFCSTPMYIGLLAAYTKHPIVQQGSYLFLSTYGFFAGLAVMLYPVSVYTTEVGINIQTMVHHGAMVLMGFLVMLMFKPTTKTFMYGIAIFLALTFVAIVLNETHAMLSLSGTFNMFFINPRFSSEIPVLSIFQPIVPGFIYIFIFLIGFSFIAWIVLQLHTFMYNKNALA